MEKYLFTDGTNVIREVESKEELAILIQSCTEPAKAKIWLFNTNEWISLADFNKRSPKNNSPVKKTPAVAETEVYPVPVRRLGIPSLAKKTLIGIAAVVAIFLIYNFTKLTWRKASTLSIIAERPENTPLVDADSLIEMIEVLRGQKLDKMTKTNLRIRNNWPDLLQLQLTAERDTSREGLRYYNIELSVDNSTGYSIDKAVAELVVWKNDGTSVTDTIQFSNISYAFPAKRKLETSYRGDSISVSFNLIRSKAFNFCYSSDKKSNYGNYNDRWFCRE